MIMCQHCTRYDEELERWVKCGKPATYNLKYDFDKTYHYCKEHYKYHKEKATR